MDDSLRVVLLGILGGFLGWSMEGGQEQSG